MSAVITQSLRTRHFLVMHTTSDLESGPTRDSMGSESTQFFDIDLTEYQNPSIDEHQFATPLSPSNNNTDEAAAPSSSGASASSNTDRAGAPSSANTNSK